MPEQIDKAKIETDEQYRNQLRRRCQTDLLFLGRDVLGYTKLLDRVHLPVVERVCVKKNPDLPIEKQDPIKPALHLDPRGAFKSTLSIADCVQWIICFPDIRICILTATKPLAAAIAGEITDHFVASYEPTIFQALFPEFCISQRDKRVGEYTAPCRTRNWREKTVMAFSIETSISGWHFDVLVPDDIVDTQNSKTPESIEMVKRNFRTNKKTLMPWGYISFKGTRYDPFDLWGDLIEKADPKKIKVLVRSALRLKSGERLEAGEFPREEDVELLFPELLSYEFLKNEFEDDYESFMSQYMNDAHGGKDVTFTREAMLQATIPAAQIPVSGQVFVAGRLSYSGKPKMRHAGVAVGVMDNGRMYVVDVLRGKFKPSALAHQIVQLAKKHGSHTVTIEETPGAKYLESAIRNYGVALGWPITITWLEFQEDDGVRELRIKGLEPLITSTRLLFSDAIKNLKELFKQFTNFGMIDDMEIPDAVSRVADVLPKSIAVIENDQEQELAWELARRRDLYDRTHGLGRYAPAVNLNEQVDRVPRNSYGLDDSLGGLNG